MFLDPIHQAYQSYCQLVQRPPLPQERNVTLFFSQAHQVAKVYRSKHIYHIAVSNRYYLVQQASKDVLRLAFLQH